MIDIHHHLLPGLDDGSPSLDVSIKMVEMAARDGITHIVCTPHANDRFFYHRDKNEALLDTLRAAIDGKVTLGLGCDFHMSYDNIQDALDTPGRFSINGGKYLLIEFADTSIPESTTDSLYELIVSKQRPIITHPERNPVIQRHPERLAAWLREGALVQVTASSLTGRFGKTAQTTAEGYLKRNWVHFLATDAHNLESRPPVLTGGYEFVKKHYGEETAQRLCVTNPKAVFDSADWPDQPEAGGLYDRPEHEQEALYGRRKVGFFSRIFGRD
jgi:protein-tyrosine phosphatase